MVGPHAARYQPSRGRQFRSMCNATDPTGQDTGPRLSLEQGKAQFAGWYDFRQGHRQSSFGHVRFVVAHFRWYATGARSPARVSPQTNPPCLWSIWAWLDRLLVVVVVLGFDLANETEYNRWWP